MRTTPRTALAILAGLTLALSGTVQAGSLIPTTAFASVPAPHTLDGAVPSVVASGQARFVSHRSPNDSISFTIALTPPNPEGLAQFVQAVNNPASPDYHHFLSQPQANTQFNPTPDQESQVEQWLTGHGLTVTGTYPNHLLVDASGTVGQAESLLGISLNTYAASIGGTERRFTAPDRAPTVDTSVASDVSAIVGLDTLPRFHILTNGSASGHPAYHPQDFANAYDVNSLWNAGYTGTGQHIGITLWTVPPSSTTLQSFTTQTGASVATAANGRLKVIPVDGGTTAAASPDQGEAGLDIEYSSGLAPGATIDYYEAPTDASGNPTGQGLIDALNLAGSDTNDNRQITNSWGECEPSSASDGFVSAAEKVFAANAATGHSYFFATGDSGSWCDPNGTGTGVDPYSQYPASSPNVTAVGGTRFSANVGSVWPGESAWAYSATGNGGSPEGSSGGYSAIFSRPSWQTGSGLAANGQRGFPDIAADADPNTGALVCYGASSACGQFGGTSLSSPLWAGMTAVLNQYLLAQGKAAAGFLAPVIYRLAGSTQTYSPLHDVTSGTNGAYNAGTGWDAVTGLGSPDLYNIARDLAGTTGGSTGTSPTPSPAPAGGLIANPGFESGSTGWQQTSTPAAQLVTSTRAHGGTSSAWFCGVNSCNDRLWQAFTVPSGVSAASLVYWTYVDSTETLVCADTLTTQIRTSAGTVIYTPGRLCNGNSSGWVQHTVNLTSFLAARPGQTLQLSFLGIGNASRPTDFFVDDVSLTVTAGATPQPTASPTPTPTSTPTGSSGTCPGSQSGCMQAMLNILNKDRSQAGVAPLTLNLTESNGAGSCVGSYGHSVHMAQMGSISHDQFPADICIAYTTAGENVGESGSGNMLTDLQQLDGLMMGEPHSGSTCASTVNHACNILNPAFHQVGIGIYGDSAGRTWLTEDFTN